MNAVAKKGWTLLLVAACLPACGQLPAGKLQAGLLVPRQLAERLERVTVFLFETENNRPRCDELLDVEGFPLHASRAQAQVTIDFQSVQIAEIEAIPDRGAVWRFHGRGYDQAGLLIAQGCDPGLYRVESGQDIQVVLVLEAVLP